MLSQLKNLACVAPAALFALVLGAAEDIRRDTTVAAVEKVMPAVVNIATETVIPSRHPLEELMREFYDPYYRRQPSRQYSLGSGVVIDEEGYVLTNDHVVQRASRISVKFSDGKEYDCDRVATSSKSDVALLKIRAKSDERFVAVKFGRDDDLLLGETVIALGNPFGLGGSVSRGILSSKNRRPLTGQEPLDVADWLQTDAAINPGNSGGPLINLKGELIGISVAVYREGQGIGFAIPIKMVSDALAASFTPERLKSLWFGARVKPGEFPLRIISIDPGSPAEKSGLKIGDRITQVEGKTVAGFIDFNRSMVAQEDRQDVQLKVLRGGNYYTVKVRLAPEKVFFNEKLIQQRTGASVQVLTRELAERLGLNVADGLLVAGVDKGSAAEKAGLEKGFLILALNGEEVGDVVSTARSLHQFKKGDNVTLQIVAPRRRGAFITIQQGTVELKLQ